MRAKELVMVEKNDENHALINLLIVNRDAQPISEQVELVAKSSGKSYTAVSNQNGIVSLRVPNGEMYIINMV